MHLVYTLARLYPYWAISVAVVLFELGVFFRRRGRRYWIHSWGTAFVLVLGVAAWIYFRGDLHADQWLRNLGA